MSSSQGTLLQLYLSFVHPIGESVWNTHYACHIQALEKVRRFALRMSAKLWDHDYNKLLLLFGLPTLESRRKILKLCYLAGTLRGAIHNTPPHLQIREMDSMQAKKLQCFHLLEPDPINTLPPPPPPPRMP